MSAIAGARLTAALIVSVAPMAVIKPADQSVTSSTTFVPDDDLVLTVAPGATYEFDAYVNYEGGTTGSSDLKLKWAGTGITTLRYGADFMSPAGLIVVTGATYQANAVVTAGTNGSNLMSVRMKGSLVGSVTGGPIRMQWAQVTSSATPTIVHAQSYLALWRNT